MTPTAADALLEKEFLAALSRRTECAIHQTGAGYGRERFRVPVDRGSFRLWSYGEEDVPESRTHAFFRRCPYTRGHRRGRTVSLVYAEEVA